MKEHEKDSGASLLPVDPPASPASTGALPKSERYQLRVRFVDAVLWDETMTTLRLLESLGMRWAGYNGHRDRPDECRDMRFCVRNGAVMARPGEWIVRDSDNQFHVYRADVFAEKYEPVIGSGNQVATEHSDSPRRSAAPEVAKAENRS